MTSQAQPISKDMLIGEFVQKYPQAVEVLLDQGVHCVGCGASHFESIEEGLKIHGKTDEDIEEVVKKLNAAVSGSTNNQPTKNSSSNEPLIITEKAAEKVKELLIQENKKGWGLRIKVVPGGCSGFKYEFSFDEKANDDDKTITINEVPFFVDEASLEHLRGSQVEYVDALSGAGFKVTNPNATSTCGCGESFS